MSNHAGRQIVITGGASGFGKGMAAAFHAQGAEVLVIDLNQSMLDTTAEELPGINTCCCDITDLAGLTAALADTDRIDVLVNNAGITHLPGPLENISESDFDQIFRVNMKAVYFTSQLVVPRMKAADGGVILNIASTAGVSPRPNLTWYNASKGWLITATKSMAAELASFGIRVNAINPVAGETPLLSSFMGEDTPETRDRFLSTIPLGRFSTPDDIAATALFLCSDEASMITGVALEVDGGRCI